MAERRWIGCHFIFSHRHTLEEAARHLLTAANEHEVQAGGLIVIAPLETVQREGEKPHLECIVLLRTDKHQSDERSGSEFKRRVVEFHVP